jgi:hypothetical protein
MSALAGQGTVLAAKPQTLPAGRIMDLQSRFGEAQEVSESTFASIAGKKWSCEVFGARSRTRKPGKVVLYHFNGPVAAATLRNVSNPLVRDYRLTPRGLVGRLHNLHDHVRLSDQGRLIAELSIDGPPVGKDFKSSANPRRNVVSYAICD